MINYKKTLDKINVLIKDEFNGHCQVMSGVLSDSIYFFKYGLMYDDKDCLDRAYKIVNYHVDVATNDILNYKFAHGLPGISWLICLLKNQDLIDDSATQYFDEIDSAIRKSLEWDNSIHSSYDYTVGMLGKAQYFLERGITQENIIVLEEIVSQLAKSAIWIDENTCTWLDYYTSGNNERKRKNILFYNLGLAHGLSSIVYFLCKFYKAGVQSSTCEKLIISTMKWIMEQENKKDFPYIYPNIVYIGEDTGRDKYEVQGWCHGLLSNGLAFLYAGKTLGNNLYMEKFDEIIEASTNILYEKALPYGHNVTINEDVKLGLNFCHGLFGLIYMYDKLYAETGNSSCQKMSVYWTDCLSNILDNVELEKMYNHGILGGLPGLGVMILQKLEIQQSSFNWDKLFLMDIENF